MCRRSPARHHGLGGVQPRAGPYSSWAGLGGGFWEGHAVPSWLLGVLLVSSCEGTPSVEAQESGTEVQGGGRRSENAAHNLGRPYFAKRLPEPRLGPRAGSLSQGLSCPFAPAFASVGVESENEHGQGRAKGRWSQGCLSSQGTHCRGPASCPAPSLWPSASGSQGGRVFWWHRGLPWQGRGRSE